MYIYIDIYICIYVYICNIKYGIHIQSFLETDCYMYALIQEQYNDDDVYLPKITTWQWVIESILILIRTSQNSINTK
jgi:hypothetical protein